MANTFTDVAPRQSMLDRLRAPMAFLLIALCAGGGYYYFFLQKKTEYYTSRDARLIARTAEQIGRAVKVGAGIVKNAATVTNQEQLKTLYKFEGAQADELRMPSKIFQSITSEKPKLRDEPSPGGEEHRYATRANEGLLLNFEYQKDQLYGSGQVELQQLLKPVQQSIGDVFDTFFIVDASGEVIYQPQRAPGDESGSNMKLVRLQELVVPRPFEKAQTLKIADLMSVSRQMPVRLGDNDYQLFSVPLHSTVHIEEGEKAKSSDMWVVCGLVATDQFRARSLQISVTVLSCLAAAVLLVIFSWPFVKMAMSSPQNKTTLADVILLGMCGILAAAVVCLAAVDWLTYDKVEHIADDQLVTLASGIEEKFNADIATATGQLDTLQRWAGQQSLADQTDHRYGDLLMLGNFGAPFFQNFALIDDKGQQAAKWSIDHVPLPLTSVARRKYFSAPISNGRDYLSVYPPPFGKRRLTIDSVRSSTTGQTEIVFARAIDEMEGDRSPLHEKFAVIAMSVSSPMSVLNATLPEDYGYAIIDSAGTVLFHSQRERNTVENFFAETDQDPKLRAAVAARQGETLNLRYWGDDYRAHVHPLKGLPWTLIMFRDKSGLRAVNTEALLTTLLFMVVLNAGGLLLFISIVLLTRPRYRAAWLWPDPNRVRDYGELAVAYGALLAAGGCLIVALDRGGLVVFPFGFVPLTLIVTYLHVRATRRLRRKVFAAVAILSAIVLAAAAWQATDWSNLAAVGAKIVASALLFVVLVRAIFREHSAPQAEGARGRQMALPLTYVSAAALLLLSISIVPTIAFFKAAYQIELSSYTKFVQIQLARSLQNRWWRLSGEFNEKRGQGKERILRARWDDPHDLHCAAYGTKIDLHGTLRTLTADPPGDDSGGFFASIEEMLPHYSEASVNTRELIHDRSVDDQWEWTRDGSLLNLTMRNADPVPNFGLTSTLPSPFPTFGAESYRTPIGAVCVLLIVALALAIAQFIARRVFLVDVVHPLWLSRGFLGLRHVICHPCDDLSANRLFRDFKARLDLSKQTDFDLTRTAPQSFPAFVPTVLIERLGYEFATGDRAEMVRGMLERLMRNPDRTVVIRPTAMGVITHAMLQGQDREAWSRILSSFVWVNGSQINADGHGVTFSGAYTISADTTAPGTRKHWLRRLTQRVYLATGFSSYFEQITDSSVVDRTIAAEVQGDPYLETLIDGLESVATGRDQVLDEIGERAAEYYTALWDSCSISEKLVLLQVAQTGLANGKERAGVRRLLARGLLRRDPQLRLMNETFCRFVRRQCTTSSLARQLEANLASDAWGRFRVPFFAAVMVVLLFFFGTQRELFDSTFAVVGGLTATIPALLKMLSTFGERGAKPA